MIRLQHLSFTALLLAPLVLAVAQPPIVLKRCSGIREENNRISE